MFSTGTLVIILLLLKVVSSVPNFAGIFKRLVALSLCVEPTKPQRTTSGKVPYSKKFIEHKA
jgi:hypothetical protein